MKTPQIFILLLFLLPLRAFAQFNIFGNASDLGGDCYQLTPNGVNKKGAIWKDEKVDLNKSFELSYSMFLGCSDFGADGICFVLQNEASDAIGASGGYFGYGGFGTDPITPSMDVEFDTYPNDYIGFSDPYPDHVAILKNGSVDHASLNNLAGPVNIFPGGEDVEDCNFHDVLIAWHANENRMEVYVDCTLRLTYTGDVIADIFAGTNLVYLGFTSGTGASTNLQKVCFNYLKYLPELNDTSICLGDTLHLGFPDEFEEYSWSPDAYISNPDVSNPDIFPPVNTDYYLEITGGCSVVYHDTLTVSVFPSVAENIDTSICSGSVITIDVGAPGLSYAWYDGSVSSTHDFSASGVYWVDISGSCSHRDSITVNAISPLTLNLGNDTSFCAGTDFTLDAGAGFSSYLWNTGSLTQSITPATAGFYNVTVTDTVGCIGKDTIHITAIYPAPPLNFPDTVIFCTGNSILLDAGAGYSEYLWFDGTTGQSVTIDTEGNYWATVTDANGCTATDTVHIPELFPYPYVNLGNDTSICTGDLLILNVSNDSSTYSWQDGSTNPVYTVTEAGTYSVTVYNQFGCVADDEVLVTENCGDNFYMVNAFSPNGDGLNDTFKPVFSGIITDYELQIWTRWGELVFESSDASAGWDGTIGDKDAEIGTYVYLVHYTVNNSAGSRSGTVTLLR